MYSISWHYHNHSSIKKITYPTIDTFWLNSAFISWYFKRNIFSFYVFLKRSTWLTLSASSFAIELNVTFVVLTIWSENQSSLIWSDSELGVPTTLWILMTDSQKVKNSFSLPVMKSIPIFWSYNPSRRTSYALAWVCPILVKFIFLTSSWKNVQSMFRPAHSYKKILNKGIWIRDSLANNFKVLYYSFFKQIICNCIIRIPPTCYNAKTVHLT